MEGLKNYLKFRERRPLYYYDPALYIYIRRAFINDSEQLIDDG